MEVLRLSYPMVLFGILSKCTPIVERHLASGMEQGSISHLGYAFRLLTTSAFLISTGITTVAFPRMALQSALTDVKALWKTISGSFRMMFLVVAPATALGLALALPLVAALFERGKFMAADSLAVCGLLQIYLLTLVATTLGNISSRAFYAIKDTRTLAIFGTVETVAYVLYTAFLASRFGVSGIAWGYVIYFCVSFTWQTAILWFRFGRGDAGGFRPFGVTAACALARTEIAVALDGEGAQCALDGLYLATGRQHIDHHTRIDHSRPHGTSREFYKGVLDGAARAVFNGKVIVQPVAQKTDAKQTNRNLLLSETARVDTKPQLEIFADDVKCTHGAAVGQLDDDAIFYLRSRGLDVDQARTLLIEAFAGDILGRIRVAPLRERLEAEMLRQLPGGAAR